MSDILDTDMTVALARLAIDEANIQTPATLATWDRGGGILTSINIDGLTTVLTFTWTATLAA